MSRFTHLHVHSHYSLLSALPKIPDLVSTAKKMNMTALALTDHGSMYGAIEFYKECKKAGIKPIIGADMFIAPRTRHDKQSGIDSRRTRLVLLAKNEQGYKNLITLVTKGFLEGFYYKPRIDKELLETYHEGLIAISTAFSGETTLALQTNDFPRAEATVEWYKKLFGSDFYLEVTHHPDIEGHNELMKKTVELSRKTHTPIVASGNVFYLKPEDKIAQRTLMLVSTGGGESIDRSALEEAGDFSFISEEQAIEYFKDLPDAIENTQKIADACTVELKLGQWVFPDYKVESGKSYDDELKDIVYRGLTRRNVTGTDDVKNRIEYELKVIRDKGYAPYFLVVGDLLKFAHENHILTTIRGSVAGSLVTYLAGITNVNPLEYNLPFERFLNPERPSAPDIDMDYADNRRDEMIDYARRKYGTNNVAQIGTFGTMMARGAVRDVSRALGFDYAIGDTISKMIPMGSQGFPMTIEHALDIVPELKKAYDTNADTKKIIDMAKKIEGCARHISVHAAGVVISPKPLTEFVPLQFDSKGENKIITQFDMHGVEDAGLLKFDFLGIKNLSILSDAVRLVKKIEDIDVDIENVNITDKKTFDMLAKGETVGLFQLNGSGMTRYLKELKPTTIHDINAMVALYRPGPMESIPQYIERKQDPSKVKYLDPRMKDILERSYGVITYQDDVMMIAIKLGGYSWLEADKLRKAMGKKIPKEMEEQKGKLREGLLKNGMTQKKADELWALIEPFAAYGFNKAHAASYGRVAYQTAYMKANFPAIYMSAVLTADSGDVEKIAEIITECKRMNIPVLPPSVNESFAGFTVVKASARTEQTVDVDKIRFGLTTIKNFGEGIANAIIEERARGGAFTSLADFLERIHDKNLNKKSLEALIKSGSMDEFGNRSQMLGNIEALLAYNKERAQESKDQDSLFGLMTDTATIPTLRLAPVPEVTPTEKLAWEKELLGLYISGHPLDKYRAVIEKRGVTIASIKEKAAKEKEATGDIKEFPVTIAGIIEDVRPVMTKKNEAMCFVKLADLTGSIDVVVFPKVLAQNRNSILVEKCLVIKGKVNERNGELSLIIDSLMPLA
ncbi:MAG TPA: DNA polymerase III subunit alpha [Candidatus Paceibacterota bacterium]|nr:DNA polymerase III subunit alpha [Candidatus Paceibacterota bacterium]